MFSGIIEATSRAQSVEAGPQILRLFLQAPSFFDDLKFGDSIAVNGVCLTLEALPQGLMQFALGPETLAVTGWTSESVMQRAFNLERSLRLNDRIHGHLVTGHVDGMGKIVERQGMDDDWLTLTVEFSHSLAPYIWKKGSVAINGVSLTVNSVSATSLSVGLIPETLKRTNLAELKVCDTVTIEVDNMARGLLRNLETR